MTRRRDAGSTTRSATCLAVCLTGCGGSEVGIVSGKVTLDGQPLTGESVVFEDTARGISVNAPLAADGTFHARTYDKPGLPPGTYHVAIRPGAVGSGQAPLVGDADPTVAPPIAVPQRYRNIKTSELTTQVEAGKNPPLEFALTKP